jgi:hypothetical protein
MVQIAMLVCGIAAGLLCKSWKQAVVVIGAVFAVGLVPQTISVAHMKGEDIGPIYWAIQVVSLAVGLGLARLLLTRRLRRSVAA